MMQWRAWLTKVTCIPAERGFSAPPARAMRLSSDSHHQKRQCGPVKVHSEHAIVWWGREGCGELLRGLIRPPAGQNTGEPGNRERPDLRHALCGAGKAFGAGSGMAAEDGTRCRVIR